MTSAMKTRPEAAKTLMKAIILQTAYPLRAPPFSDVSLKRRHVQQSYVLVNQAMITVFAWHSKQRFEATCHKPKSKKTPNCAEQNELVPGSNCDTRQYLNTAEKISTTGRRHREARLNVVIVGLDPHRNIKFLIQGFEHGPLG